VKVVSVPSSLDEHTFDQLLEGLEPEKAERVLIDARHLRFADPFGMLGLLALAQYVGRTGEAPILQLPDEGDVVGYMARMDFFEQAESLFEIHGGTKKKRQDGGSDVLLEITAVNSHQDVHSVIDRVNSRAIDILTKQLNYPRPQAAQFSTILSEVTQNIVEHAEAGGWVATQTYTWQRRLGGRKVVIIAVMDLGIGFRSSLSSAHATRFADRWNDATALESAFMHGMSRFHDPGRGQGLQQIRRNVNRWGGKFSIRSGTARIADVPVWEEGSPLDENLPYLPGAQICIILPDRPEAETKEGAAPRGTRTR
jgi:anti-sigma regulatory factor (Ser/Thr protein kinase)